MTIKTELEDQVLRYYHVEKWKVGTIARHLNVHHSVVSRLLNAKGVLKTREVKTPRLIDPFVPFVMETLSKYPTLTASRLYGMVKERGYRGGEDHFRAMVAKHRPRKVAEAYLRLRTLPGEQGQVDWGDFGWITIGQAKRKLMAFVMVLSYSRKLFVQFYLNAQMGNFLRGHEAALHFFGGVPRVLLYDNLRSCVLERQGEAIRFNTILLDCARHYRFEPRPVAVARGNEKGRVERSIRYVRDNFFKGRTYKDLDDLNAQALEWCQTTASNRRCPEVKDKRVEEVFLEEQPHLMRLPDNPFDTDEREEVMVGKTPYVRYDLNDYSVPHDYTRTIVTLIGKPTEVLIVCGEDLLARHVRSYDKGQQIEDPLHIKALVDRKKEAREHRYKDQLMMSIPCAKNFLIAAAAKGYVLATLNRHLTELLEAHGSTLLSQAMQKALERGSPHLNSVRLALDKLLEKKTTTLVGPYLQDQRARQVHIKPHDLSLYKNLHTQHNQINGDDHE